MKYSIRYSSKFQKDLKCVQKRNYNMSLMSEIIKLLVSGHALPSKYRDHALAGNYRGSRECHIAPDWLLIYEIDEKTHTLYLTRTGSHSDLF